MKLEGTFTDRMKTDGWLLLHQEWPPKEEGSGVDGISNTGEQERKKSRSGSLFQRALRLVVCCNDGGNKIHVHNFNLRGNVQHGNCRYG